MNLFYADPGDIQHQSLTIKGQEAEHITKVLRYSAGDKLTVTDGKGKVYDCRIRDFQKRAVLLDVLNLDEEPPGNPGVTLCMGIIKKRDRLEFAVEKAVELGVSKIVLFRGEHSQKGNIREDRLTSTAISAMKQSLRFYLPEIFVTDSLQDAILLHAEDSTVVVADETRKKTENQRKAAYYFLVVGPEGGFSDSERGYLRAIQPVYYSLGDKRLRTETAAIVMIDRFMNMP